MWFSEKKRKTNTTSRERKVKRTQCWKHILYECISSKSFPGDFIKLLENAHISHWMDVCYFLGFQWWFGHRRCEQSLGNTVITFSSSVILSVGMYSLMHCTTGSIRKTSYGLAVVCILRKVATRFIDLIFNTFSKRSFASWAHQLS